MKSKVSRFISVSVAVAVIFIAQTEAQPGPSHLQSHRQVLMERLKSALHGSNKAPKAHGRNSSCIEWQSTIGGSSEEDRGAIRAIPGGYITCGSTTSPDGDFHVPAGHDHDAYVAKLNSAGNVEWARNYGGTTYDDFNDIIQTSDGGFIAIGASTSSDGDLSGNHGDEDVWVVKLDRRGKIQWQKNYGGLMEDHGNFIVETPTGYAFCAGAASTDGDLTQVNAHGLLDAWIVEISYTGKILFQQTYGGSEDEDANGIFFNEKDKTIIFASTTSSNNGDVNNYHDGGDAWVVKINDSGNILWKRTLGGTGWDALNSMARTTDGNVVIASFSNSIDGDLAGNNGLFAAWLVKLDAVSGKIIWNKTYPDPPQTGALGVIATDDGGAVAMGLSAISLEEDTWDAWVMKTDEKGDEQWTKVFGGSKQDYAAFGAIAPNGNIITSNYTASNDGDVKKSYGQGDIWMVSFGKCGNMHGHEIDLQKNTRPTISYNTGVYPNPFSNSTNFSFTTATPQKVSVMIYDMNGRLMRTLLNDVMQPGIHQIKWNAKDDKGNGVAAGMYILKLQTSSSSETIKLSVIK
jgi:hypothetical protein